ncbi:non-ribosomal peptide synthetase [Candidatus Methylobacter oryzae]|uniref:Amino acid adenylation domain-containing protein n=1 Tax=Candidatus Methylobacter oryzae TaxID=2497749 RepID=A0ABY3C933_9GAMM|nr:non-ribosomal peptide synthetase [Candidatus Methylobacter oryzae]TRW90360.1 amino acid adenylation domain-containing protein [Candidatus Methylobacter oryzae]
MDKKLVQSVFLGVSRAFPHNTAISEPNRNISFEHLNQCANQAAAQLLQHGVKNGDVVGLLIEASIDYVIAMLAVLKAGGIFMALDPDTPKKRLEFIIDKTAPKRVITNKPEFVEIVSGYPVAVTMLATSLHETALEPEVVVDGNDSAYIVFTSGSTGFPKAIEGQHKGLSHFIHWEMKTFGLTETTRVAWLAPPTFDVSLRDIFVPLLSGGTLVIPDAELRKKTAYLPTWLTDNKVTLMHCVPSLFRMLTREFQEHNSSNALPGLQRILLAGEPLYAKDVIAWRELFGERIELVNIYGPSETTLAKAYYPIKNPPAQPQAMIPIGQAISNSALLIIKSGRLCSIGEIGEIYIKTPFRSKGYYGDPELTAAVFVQNPLHQESEDIVYKTGDSGRYLPDHSVEFLGRQDNQVKINGVRIELAEIEQAVLTHDAIDQAVVIAHAVDRRDKVLVCYFIAHTSLSNDALREHLRQWLPSAMLPTFFVPLTEMPLNLHGKVDRKALPKPDELLYAEHYQAPENDIEVELVKQWQQLLGLNKIGVTHAFMDIGGDSLKAMRMVSGIYKVFNVDISLKDFFAQPTIRQLARLIAAAKTAEKHQILPVRQALDYAVSHSQKRLWLMDRMHIDSVAYNLPEALLINGDLNVQALSDALQVLVDRHESLRTRFIERNGEPRQIIEAIRAELPLIDLSTLTDPDAEALMHVDKDLRQAFDFQRAPLFRTRLLKLAPQRHVLLFNIHHIISDGWSLGVLTREWMSVYQALRNDQTPSLTPLSIQYKDYAAWQNQYLESPEALKHRQYWLKQLSGELPVLNMPADYLRPAVQTFNGATLHFKLPDFALQQFKALLNARQASLFMGLCAVVKILLYRYTAQQDLILGTPVAGRGHSDLENQLGFYVNTLALRDSIDPGQSFAALVDQINATAIAAFDHQLYPFDMLVNDLTIQRDMSRSPVFDAMLALQNNETGITAIDGLNIEPFVKENHWDISRYDLLFHFSEAADGLELDLNFNPDLFAETRMQRLGGHILQLFDSILRQPECAVAKLPMLTALELQQLASFNPIGTDTAGNMTIADVFERQAASTPDNDALVTPEYTLTYKQLNSQANQCAKRLQALVPEGSVAAVYSERVDPLLLLACAKAGVVYLPIDAGLPLQRVLYMLEQSGCRTLLHRCQTAVPAVLASAYPCLAWAGENDSGLDVTNPQRQTRTDDIAYILYTSGSTGRPKGVRVKHDGFVNMALAQIDGFSVSAGDRVLQFASIAFDASLSEVFMALFSGAALLTIDQATINDTAGFIDYLARYRVSHLTLPPVYLRALQRQAMPTLKTLITAGEAPHIDDALHYARRCAYFNAYGPTETSVCASFYRVDAQNDYRQRIPVGAALPNLAIYVLDDAHNPQPVGVAGEIYIGGIGVAKDYVNAPELTAASFVSLPQLCPATLYKTGDLGCWNEAGQLEYIGRKDRQVKVSGYRIETAEVAYALRQFPEVEQAVVTVQKDGREQNALCAYYTRAGKVELWPSIAEFYVYDDIVYRSMATDHARNARYRAAFAKVLQGKTVVEIGPGPEAILSRLCLEAGAEKIYAIELLEETYRKAQQTLKRLGLEDKIQLLHGNAMTVELPEQVDYCISEIVGGIGGSEGAAKIINSARRFLRNPQNMLPTRSLTKIGAIQLSESDFDFHFSAIAAHYVERIFSQTGYPFDLRLCLKGLPDSALISNADVFEDLDYTRDIPLESEHDIVLNFDKDSLFTGFLVWLTLYPDADEVIDILYSQDSWIPVYLPVSIAGIAVRKGDVFKASLQRKLCANGLNPDYFIDGTLYKADGQEIPVSYAAYHNQPQFQSGEFYRRLFPGKGEIPVRPALQVAKLRAFLAESLPAYMIPAHFTELENLPLNSSGKVDLKALPVPFTVNSSVQGDHYAAPTTGAERHLVEVWQDVLDQRPIGIHDHYFHRGGDSIRAIQIVARLREHNLKLDVRDIFQYPTIYELATQVTEVVKAVDQSPVIGVIPLTPIQHWFFAQNTPEPQHFNQAVLLKLNGRAQKADLQTVLEHLYRHHDALRIQFKIGVDIAQQINGAEGIVNLQEVDLREQAEPAQAMQQHADAAQAAIDLSAGPLFNAVLYRLPEQDCLLLFCHHLVIDGVSWRILLEDFSSAYRQVLDAQTITLPLKTDSFKSHAERLQLFAESGELSQQLVYWQTLASIVEPEPQASAATIADAGEYAFALNEADTHLLLTDTHQAFNTRIDDVLLAALSMTLYQWQGRRQTVIEMEGHGRDQLEGLDTQRTVGWFTVAYPKLLQYDPQQNLADLLKETKESLRLIPNKGLGYGVLRYLQGRPELALTPEIGFNYLGQMDGADRNELFSIDWQGLGRAVSAKMPLAHDLDILSLVENKALQFHIAYNTLRYQDESIRQLGDLYRQNITLLIAFCMEQDGSELTPSDLTYREISIDELDLLFDE